MPRPLPRHIGRALVVSVLTVAPLAAQPVTPPPAGARPVGAPIGAVPRGERVRVSVGGRRLEGWAQGTAGDTLLVRTGPGELARVPAPAIDALWLRDRRATGRGAKIGAGLGAVALGGLALLFTQAVCEQESCLDSEAFGITLLGATVGAGGGAIAGGLIGSLVPAWRRVRP